MEPDGNLRAMACPEGLGRAMDLPVRIVVRQYQLSRSHTAAPLGGRRLSRQPEKETCNRLTTRVLHSCPMEDETTVRQKLEELRVAFMTSDGTGPMHE